MELEMFISVESQLEKVLDCLLNRSKNVVCASDLRQHSVDFLGKFEDLDLSSNQITHISNQINKLTQFQFLELSTTQLTQFPYERKFEKWHFKLWN
jgi:Leucine-rich repeat (LRR) protein